MASAHLLIPDDERRTVLSLGSRLPVVPVERLPRSGEVLGLDLAVVRTVARLGDDRVVLCELLDVDAPIPATASWADPLRLTDDTPVRSVATEFLHDPTPAPDLLPWEQEGWLREVLGWVDAPLHAAGMARTGSPIQLRHWGLSAVLRVPTADGHVVVKQVPAGLGAEGRVTAWLSSVEPDAVPRVLARDDDLCRFVMEGVESSEQVAPSDVLSLSAIQRATAAQPRELVGLGLPNLRPEALAQAARRLAHRGDLLFDSGWSLASSDSRRPQRSVTAGDVTALLRLLDELEPLARRLDEDMPDGTIVHGDYHMGNLLRDGSRRVVIDWGQAAIGHPLFDLPAWPSWDAQDDPANAPFLSAWGCSIGQWERIRPLAFVFHAVTAARIADAMPAGHRRSDWAAAVQKLVLRALES